jgi:hypothetical protein
MNPDQFQIDAISGITDPESIRVVLLINDRFVHAPLPSLIGHLLTRIEELEERVTDLETP